MIDATPSHAVLREFFDNSSLTWGLMACGVAQLSKLFLELLLHRRWRPAVLIETGGMPSSHSALVTGTAACVGWTLGFDHPLFALAAMVAFVVMYDASGIRRAAGLTAERVNGLPDSLWPDAPEKPLKESLGSQPAAGAGGQPDGSRRCSARFGICGITAASAGSGLGAGLG